MKKIITGALVLALTVGAAEAQTTSTQEKKHHKKEHRMDGFKQLNLSADQKAQLKTIHQGFKKQFSDLKKQDQIPVAEMRKRRKELHQQFRSKKESILTAEQKGQLEKMRSEKKEKNSQALHRNKNGKGFRKATGLQKELNLTQHQKDKIKEMRSDLKNQFETLRNDKSLTDDQKKEKVTEIRKQQMKQIKTVLTKEQMDKFKSLKKEHEAKNTK